MDLLLSGAFAQLAGEPMGVNGQVYTEWDGYVLKSVPKQDADELLSLPGYFTKAGGKQPLALPLDAPAGTPEAGKQDTEGEAKDDPGVSAAELKKLSKADLLMRVDAAERAEVAKLSKDAIIAHLRGER